MLRPFDGLGTWVGSRRVFAPLEQVAKDIIRDTPNERYDFVVRCLIQFAILFLEI